MDEKDNDLLPYEPKDGLIELVDDFDELIEAMRDFVKG